MTLVTTNTPRADPSGVTGATTPGAPVHIIAGSWPPMRGGVADHSRILATGLAHRGYRVHVWASREGTEPGPDGVEVHPVLARWSPAELRAVGAAIDAMPGPHRVIVQWVPHDFGWKSLNVAFAAWLLARARRGDCVLPLVHEAGLPFRTTRFGVLAGAAIHRVMAALLLRAAHRRVWITVPIWQRRLAPWALGRRLEWDWLPVPSNIVAHEDASARDEVRARLARDGAIIIGSFGIHGGPATATLARVLARLLQQRGRVALVMGPSGRTVRDAVGAVDDSGAERVHVTGELAPRDVSAHLAACDVMVQVYLDGVSARRGSAMAALAHRRPLVTTTGVATEPVWGEECAARMAEVDEASLVDAVESLLADPAALADLGRRGRECYDRHFAAERMIERVAATLGAPFT